jgi:hypothetical protein
MKPRLAKGCLAAVAGLTVLFGTCVGGLFLWVAVATQDSAEAADGFLALLADGRTRDAYVSAAPALRSNQDEQTFTAIVDRLGIVGYEMEDWTDRTLEGRQGTGYRATLFTTDGGAIPVILGMRRVVDDWKVISLTDLSRLGVGPGVWFRLAPTEEELRGLITGVFLKFQQGVDVGDFREFHDSLAPAFRINASLLLLQEAYQHFIDDRVDISAVADVEAVFDRPARLSTTRFGDRVSVSGRYMIEPEPVTFKLQFLYYHPEWKLNTHTIKVGDE